MDHSTPCIFLRRFRTELRLLAVVAATLLPIGGVSAQGASSGKPCDPAPAKAVSVQGTVESKGPADAQWQPVKLNDTFCPGDSIRVHAKSRADIALRNQSVMRLNANSTITVETPKEQTTGVVRLLRGATNIFSRGGRSLEVITPFTVAGVRGTEFFISVENDKTLLSVFEGTVVAENSAGSLLLHSGQSAVAESGKIPVLRTVVRPRDAVQWTLHYPPVVYFRPDEFPSGPGWQGMIRRSAEFYAKGDLTGALQSIENAPADVRDPRFFVYRAQLLLAVGRVDDAHADIDRALQLAPNDANALSLQSIIAVVQNDKDRALAVAEKNVAANPTSATARIALSFAQQARFDLPGARASVEKAVELDPRNALALARLAELNSSFGDLDATFAAAQKAVALDPNLARIQTVLGFAYLTQVRTAEARAAFDKAIVLDQGDPLPRLGLGLAKIRDGRLDEGGRDIEIAASLDPTNSIVRAYLGKLYYEEKRFPLDEREYQMAQELDPKDPTAFFYDAILKQTTNRPVEALQAMEQAIALNDNRAVYRSELLLDSDNASRSASLARIYTDLGFQQFALVEGYKSVNADPTNFSAHRFLSDTYSVLPRHEIARVSELLQSQLLQPINLTPLQPRLAVSNLALISSSGVGTASFSEFNPLFTGDGYTAQFTGMGGEHGTYAGDAVVAGLVGKGAFSFGYSGFQTDGFRVNSDQKDQIFNAFGQYDFTPQTSVQAEYRHRNTKQGDVALRFFESDFLPGERNHTETDMVRAGFRHTFSPGSIVLASVIYQNSRDTVHQRPVGGTNHSAYCRHARKSAERRTGLPVPIAALQPRCRSRLLQDRRAHGLHARSRHSAPRRSGSFPGSGNDCRRCPACQRLRLRLFQAVRQPDPDSGRQRRLPERRQPGRRRQEGGQPQVRRGMEPVAGHDAASGGVQGGEADACDRSDARANTGCRIQSILRRPQRGLVVALRGGDRSEVRARRVRRRGVFEAGRQVAVRVRRSRGRCGPDAAT